MPPDHFPSLDDPPMIAMLKDGPLDGRICDLSGRYDLVTFPVPNRPMAAYLLDPDARVISHPRFANLAVSQRFNHDTQQWEDEPPPFAAANYRKTDVVTGEGQTVFEWESAR